MAKAIILATMIVTLFITGCARGEDGDVYLKIFLQPGIWGYTDTNPDIPSDSDPNTFYPTKPGSFEYKFFYRAHGLLQNRTGKYTLTAEEGEKGIFQGSKGKTKRYILNCSTNGAFLSTE